MKIIKEGILKTPTLNWPREREFVCQRCRAVWMLEGGDTYLSRPGRYNEQWAGSQCPTCGKESWILCEATP